MECIEVKWKMVRTTVSFDGVSELILEKAVRLGLAKSRTEALRMGVFALNKEYGVVKDIEMEMVARKLAKEEAEAKRKHVRMIPLEEALAPYKKR
ncbi:MAG: hypothetical protein V1847_03720 [Candidatus Diapherotrites archaeon]